MVNSTALLAVVRADIEKSGRTIKDLAAESGINRITLGRRLNGTSPFTWDELYALGRAFGVTPLHWVSRAEQAAS